MNELVCQVEFLSDIVLPATSNTEGNIGQLDFIPGSNFLGMAARQYDSYADSFAVFHSGDVRFGDATLLKNGKQTYKTPLSYFHEKLEDKKLFNHHLIEDFSKFNQLKQLRKGYVTSAREWVDIDYGYAQKSAYDKEKRRSKESSMYGYTSMPKGSKWQFTVKYNNSVSKEDIERVMKNLEGKKRLGKSKSSQYGQIKIVLQGKNENIEKPVEGKEVLLYANSRLALVDESGNPSYNLMHICEGLNDDNIVWEKCQLRTSSFSRYDGSRKTKDYERIMINSGSVIVLKDISQEQLLCLNQGVGVYLSEGFGELLVNPTLLSDNDFTLIKDFNALKTVEEAKVITETFKERPVQFLVNRHNDKFTKNDLADAVSQFIKDNRSLYGNITPSQWGTIRSICTRGKSHFHEDIEAYIKEGQKSWDPNQIVTLMGKIKNNLEFAKLLSMQMPKQQKKTTQGDKK